MEDKVRQLATMLSLYRNDELDFVIDEQHVLRWIEQFTEDVRNIILNETIYIFEKWYFHKTDYIRFFDVVLRYLARKYTCSEQKVIKNTVFVNEQNNGLSQHKLITWFSEEMVDRYGIALKTEISSGFSYVYLDDGLYTGKRAQQDILSLISILPYGSSLFGFYMVAGMKGLKYVESQIKPVAKKRGIEVEFFRMHPIENDKQIDFFNEEDGKNVVSYTPKYMCLWPSVLHSKDSSIVRYEHELKAMGDNCEKKLYREKKWLNDRGLFTSVENRNVVEKEFLLKGIQIIKSCETKTGLYPLGFNRWPSFGFGSFTASDINISNTCPLVLWWGNNIRQNNVLDAWYPLLPRRINCRDTPGIDIDEDMMLFESTCDTNERYNMCPDCGKYFGIQNDGGNGFCIDCAWKH